MDAADAAVLNAIQDDLLRPEVLDLALSEALEMLKPSAMMNTDRRAELKTELAKVEAEARSYAEAIAKQGPLDSILAALKIREERRVALRRQLDSMTTQAKRPVFDSKRIALDLQNRLDGWRELLKRQTMEARQIIRNLLVGRLAFTPGQDEEGSLYTFTGQGSISAILSGVVRQDVSNPAGVTNRNSRTSEVSHSFPRRARDLRKPRNSPQSDIEMATKWQRIGACQDGLGRDRRDARRAQAGAGRSSSSAQAGPP
jgi:hypothetical protein